MTVSRSVPLSVLDLAPVVNGSTAAEALRNTLDLARHVDRLGYRRYWLAEHHNMPGIASSSPAVLIGHVADATSRLRVGSGGVMLPNHAPLVVAEQFGTLAALHPGRIDLGIGRAPGTDPATAQALRRSIDPLSAEDFPRQLGELIHYLAGDTSQDDAEAASPDLLHVATLSDSRPVRAFPNADARPPLWLLGSSGYSAQVAGILGLPFAFAHHFSAANTLPALELYRTRFRPSPTLDRPYAMVAAAVVCADSDEHAHWLAGPNRLSMLRLRSGRPGPLPTPEEAAAYPYTAAERQLIDAHTSSQIVGDPSTVEKRVDELLELTRADELMVTTMVHPHADRLRSYELLADLFATHRFLS